MTADISPASPHRWLRAGLVLVAALEFLEALSGVPNIFTDYHHDTELLRFVQALTSMRLALAPVIAGAALVYAALGRIRHAIFALAALTLMVWLLDAVPDMAIRGIRLSPDYGGLESIAHGFVFPAAALTAGALAYQGRRLAFAGLLASLATLFNWIGVAAFIVVVLTRGF